MDHVALSGDGDAPALVTKSVTISFAQLETMVGTLAGALQARVPEPGARVATWLPKTVEACLMPLAAPRAGLVHVPVNPVLKRAQVAHILSDSGASLLLTSAARAATLEAGDVPEGCAVWLEEEARAVDATALRPSSADPDTLAAILYTSGSTGRPKGVMLSHANLWLGAVSVAHYLGLQPDDRTLAVLPLGFDYGQNQLFSTWKAGGAVYPFDFLMPKDVWRAIEREGITTLAAVPPLWLQLVETEAPPAQSIRRITNSGGALTPALIDRLRPRVPNADIYPMYGLTEAFRSTYLPPALVASHPSSMGCAIPFAEVMAVAPDGSEAASGQPGELVHAGPLVAQGYWQDAERTAVRFKPAPGWSQSGGMAVWSGDTVKRDADGLFYFVGRDDEMIKTSGHRISPLEIEEAALASGVVAEAVAHAIPDPATGQATRLVLRGTGDSEALSAHLKRELPSHMQPKTIEWRDELPRNANGKIDRSAIRSEVA
ncbi:acyl-CoA ligase (AMP-forming), exosortase A system-associated [Sphingomonas sp. SUN039]|nr:acyl-CoA ligase (AMP-forming), exosortase A system-associated [Sphingomonas sp. SUN039]UVO55824.1 acyl-CoA ligase (AMP-forming), exosortase A system-associated [Sphingomonas sp. SUN039]